MVETDAMEGLSGELLRVVADPSKVEDLYRILGEYCHLIRNRLNSLNLGMYLARRTGPAAGGTPWPELDRRCTDLEQFIERLQTICRPMRLSPFQGTIELLVQHLAPAWERAFAARRIRLEMHPPRRPAVGTFDLIRLGQGLDALAAWRCKALPPGSAVRLDWRSADEDLVLEWVERVDPEAMTDRGREEPDSSLALPLLARILSVHGGRLHLTRDGGIRLELRWPIARRSG